MERYVFKRHLFKDIMMKRIGCIHFTLSYGLFGVEYLVVQTIVEKLVVGRDFKIFFYKVWATRKNRIIEIIRFFNATLKSHGNYLQSTNKVSIRIFKLCSFRKTIFA
jgi:hypothetical protein